MSRRRIAVLLTVLAALALGATACGGTEDKGAGSDGDATGLLRDTFGADHPIRSGRLDASLDLDLRGMAKLDVPLNLHLNGPFQSNGGAKLPDFALDVDFQGGEKPITVGAVFAQGGGFLTIEGQAFDLGSDLYNSFKTGYEKAKAESAKSDAAKSQTTLSALGISPLRWLENPKNEGDEDIAGTKTVHLSSGVNVAKLLEDVSTLLGKAKGVTGSAGASVPTQLSAEQRAAIAKAIKSAKVDIWTGAEDHTLRKVAVNVQVDVDGKPGHVIFQITIGQLNQRQAIKKPAGARPLTELRAALQELGLVGAGSAATSAAPSATTATPATGTDTGAAAGAPNAYADCIDAAGDDLAKVQECAEYLNK